VICNFFFPALKCIDAVIRDTIGVHFILKLKKNFCVLGGSGLTFSLIYIVFV
jgi:cellobiose-specific phosphotransferase system component IIC